MNNDMSMNHLSLPYKRYLHLSVSRRSYSTSSMSKSSPCLSLPAPIKTLDNLHDDNVILSYNELLRNKAGIYCFHNTVNGKRYIGSAKNLYLRLSEHISNRKSNKALQNAFLKHGLDKFNFCVYEYFTYHSKVVSHKALMDLETSYIEKHPFDMLYNFMKTATSLTGYKHTDEAKLKMLNRFKDKFNHPMYGKKHTQNALKLISKPGKLNPMFGKQHSDIAREKMSNRKNKHPNGIGLYDINNNLISKFQNNVELAKHLNVSKVTIGKYLNSGIVFNKMYRFKVINP